MNFNNTYSVAIPAHNEEQNIAFLLKQVFAQKTEKFELEKVVVYCDGCTDKTVEIVNSLCSKYPKLVCLTDIKRLGKSQRLNMAYSDNCSDFLITLDADQALVGIDVFTCLLTNFSNKSVQLVSGNSYPLESRTYFGKVVRAKELIWLNARENYRNGNNIYNISGSIVVLRKGFAKKIKFPRNLVSDQQYLFLSSRKINNEAFVFEKNAKSMYYLPDNFLDFIQFVSRLKNENDLINKCFLNIEHEYYISISSKILGTTRQFMQDPLSTLFALILMLITNNVNLKKSKLNSAVWEPVISTKNIYKIK